MKRYSIAFLAALVLAAALGLKTSHTATPVRLVRGPYLQAASETGVRILWSTDRRAGTRVDFGTAGYDTQVAAPAPVTRHEIALAGLQPGTRYRYRVVSAGQPLHESTFTTNKAAGEPFRFAVFGDSGSGNTRQWTLAARVASAAPDFVLHTGDVVYPRGEQKHYDARFFRPYAWLLAHVPIWPVLGNHDVMVAGGRAFLDNFVLPRNGPAGVGPERNYSFDYADAHVAAVDTDLDEATLRDRVAPWLRRDMAASGKRWRFVFFHHPPYSSGPHGENRRVQRALVPALTAAGVDVVFNGHDHAYERIQPQNGVVYVVTGAGGNGLYPRKQTHAYTARFYNRAYSYTLVDVSGPRLRLRQITAGGQTVDEITWDKK